MNQATGLDAQAGLCPVKCGTSVTGWNRMGGRDTDLDLRLGWGTVLECSLGTGWGGKADTWDFPAGAQGPPGWPACSHWLPGPAGILGAAEPAERPKHCGPGPQRRWEDYLLRAGPRAPGGDGRQCGWQCLRYSGL